MKKQTKKVEKVKKKTTSHPKMVNQPTTDEDRDGTRADGSEVGTKTYNEKLADYKEHFDGLGMSDPGTEARIQAMETAPVRVDETTDEERAPDLVERDRVRVAKSKETRDLNSGVAGTTNKFGQIPSERKAMNEKLSDKLHDRKEHDEAITEGTEEPIPTGTNRDQKKGSR